MELNAQHITDLTKMKKQKDKIPKPSKNHSNSITNAFILLIFSILSLFFESVIIIISLFKKGIFKKEILSKKTNTNTSITNNFIILIFSVISLFIESIIIIISLFKKGIFKREILSKKTNLGFDLIIKRK